MSKPSLTNQKSNPIAIPKAPQGASSTQKKEETPNIANRQAKLAKKATNFSSYLKAQEKDNNKLVSRALINQRPGGGPGPLSKPGAP